MEALTNKLLTLSQNEQNVFFTSDTHFGHSNIIKFSHRPFSSIEEHDETLIENWNKVVPKKGIVYHLGDVGWGNHDYLRDVLNRLNGRIVLVIGNHDWKNIVKQHADRFVFMTQQINMQINKQKVILNHYPLLCYAGTYREKPTWQLYGHVHSGPLSTTGLDNDRLTMCFPTQYDVGVDNNDFAPVSFLKIREIIEQQIKEA